MKLKFDPSLEYQQDAISAVVNAFEGQPIRNPALKLARLPEVVCFSPGLASASRIPWAMVNCSPMYRKSRPQTAWKQAMPGKGATPQVPGVAIRKGMLKSIKMGEDHFLTLQDSEFYCYGKLVYRVWLFGGEDFVPRIHPISKKPCPALDRRSHGKTIIQNRTWRNKAAGNAD